MVCHVSDHDSSGREEGCGGWSGVRCGGVETFIAGLGWAGGEEEGESVADAKCLNRLLCRAIRVRAQDRAHLGRSEASIIRGTESPRKFARGNHN
jgi:hypothetical protein